MSLIIWKFMKDFCLSYCMMKTMINNASSVIFRFSNFTTEYLNDGGTHLTFSKCASNLLGHNRQVVFRTHLSGLGLPDQLLLTGRSSILTQVCISKTSAFRKINGLTACYINWGHINCTVFPPQNDEQPQPNNWSGSLSFQRDYSQA